VARRRSPTSIPFHGDIVLNVGLSPQYLAGLFDGEGSITIGHKRYDYRGSLYHYYLFQLRISNTCRHVLELVQKIWGGNIQSSGPHRFHRKQCYYLHLSSRKALLFLEHIYPYLVIKSAVAWVAICFQRHVTLSPHKHRTVPIGQYDLEARQAAREIVIKMNGDRHRILK
jgi:hypothetical protein